MRIQRNIAHLITTIAEVLSDMQVFFFLLTMLIFAFASSFFILGRNNSSDETFTQAVMASY